MVTHRDNAVFLGNLDWWVNYAGRHLKLRDFANWPAVFEHEETGQKFVIKVSGSLKIDEQRKVVVINVEKFTDAVYAPQITGLDFRWVSFLTNQEIVDLGMHYVKWDGMPMYGSSVRYETRQRYLRWCELFK